jgi:glycosyltransferase involved in cell wall biosynthesis
MRLLLKHQPDLRIVFLDRIQDFEQNLLTVSAQPTTFESVRMIHVTCRTPSVSPLLPLFTRHRLIAQQYKMIADYALCWRPNVVQASGVGELQVALRIGKHTGARLIYDSHEDYYRQAVDYNRGLLKARISGMLIAATELLLIRNFNDVFCTDDYLYSKYLHRYYAARHVHLLRNFPYEVVENNAKFAPKDFLYLVYIGDFNPYRGVRECAEFCDRFNKEFDDKQLRFVVYAPDHALLDELVQKGIVERYGWVDYPKLMTKLQKYDVGVCLWHSIPKFHRNLPLKNFDYMAAGLPILTSNFGNLKRYLDISQAGIGINPTSYIEFREAVLRLFDPVQRRRFSKNGQKCIRESWNFCREGEEYVKCILAN